MNLLCSFFLSFFLSFTRASSRNLLSGSGEVWVSICKLFRQRWRNRTRSGGIDSSRKSWERHVRFKYKSRSHISSRDTENEFQDLFFEVFKIVLSTTKDNSSGLRPLSPTECSVLFLVTSSQHVSCVERGGGERGRGLSLIHI